MGTVRANWHLADLDVAVGDPMLEIAHVMETGDVIDLTRTRLDLIGELSSLVRKEGRYWQYAKADDGESPLMCELKWSGRHSLQDPAADLTCFNCPHYSDDRTAAKSLICSLGREQSELVEHLRALETVDSLETELAAAFTPEIEESAALAEAHLAAL